MTKGTAEAAVPFLQFRGPSWKVFRDLRFPSGHTKVYKTLKMPFGSSDAYASRLPSATSFAITDVRLVAPVMCSVPGTPK
jgi:hypothetical protein